jgi:GntR family transcriptional regulator
MSFSSYAELARALVEEIAKGHYPIGSLLPTEFELCEQHGLSRYAVRKALDDVQEMGLISRRKNVGSRVEALRPSIGFVQSLATIDALAHFGAIYERQIKDMRDVVLDIELAKQLGCEAGSQWFQLSSLRVASGTREKPICWTDVYLEPKYAKLRRKFQAAPDTLISQLIEAHDGRAIASIAQDIEAVSISSELADALDAEVGAPALHITRRYADLTGTVFEVSRSVHPGGRFKLSTQLTRATER